MKKLLFFIVSLCTINLNNIECVYSMDYNNELSTIFETLKSDDASDDTNDDEIFIINSNKSLDNQSNTLDSNTNKERLKIAANLITLQDIKSLEQGLYGEKDENCLLNCKNALASLKNSVFIMQQYPTRYNIMKCYMDIKKLFSCNYWFNSVDGYLNVNKFLLDIDNTNEQSFEKKFSNLDLKNIKKFLMYFNENILPQIYEIQIDISKYPIKLGSELIRLSNSINDKILKLKNCTDYLKTQLTNLKHHVKPSDLEKLNDLEEAINKKNYYKIMNMNDVTLKLKSSNTLTKKIATTICDMYDYMEYIITTAIDFSSLLYYSMKEFHYKYISFKKYVLYLIKELRELIMQSKNIDSREALDILGNLKDKISKAPLEQIDDTTYLPLRNVIFTLGDKINNHIHARNIVIAIRNEIKNIFN